MGVCTSMGFEKCKVRVFKAVGSSEATCRTGVPKVKQFMC